MGLLDIQIDMYHFRRLLQSLATDRNGLTPEVFCVRVIYYIGKYKNSPDVTEQQMAVVLKYADMCFSLMFEYKPEEFLNEILQTIAASHIRTYGLDALLDKPFSTLSCVDKVYLLYLELYCTTLRSNSARMDYRVKDVDRALETVEKRRNADKPYANKLPTREILIEPFEKLENGKFKLEDKEKSDIFSGRGIFSLQVICQSDNNRKLLSDMHIACKPIEEGLAYPSKIGVYDNLFVDSNGENDRYMVEHRIPFAVNENGYLISRPECDTLLMLTYRDLVKLWPTVRYFLVSKYMLEDDDETEFPTRKDFCKAMDEVGLFFPLPDPINIVRLR